MKRDVMSYYKKDFNLIDNKNASNVLVSQAVRVHLQNSRQGTVAVKGRSDISFSNKKPWKQKGTGRARAGTKSSPIWRSGGVCFGPQPRVRVLHLSKKMRKLSCLSVLMDILERGALIYIKHTFSKPHTKEARELLHGHNVATQDILFLYDSSDLNTYFSMRNLSGIRMCSFDAMDTYSLLSKKNIVFLEKDLSLLCIIIEAWKNDK